MRTHVSLAIATEFDKVGHDKRHEVSPLDLCTVIEKQGYRVEKRDRS